LCAILDSRTTLEHSGSREQRGRAGQKAGTESGTPNYLQPKRFEKGIPTATFIIGL